MPGCAGCSRDRDADARSLLQGGNVVFRSDITSTAKLEQVLAAGTKKHLGVDTDFFVRTARELNAAIAANPFLAEAKSDPGHLLLLFLKDTPAASAVTTLQGAIAGRETLKVKGPHAYVVYRDGIGNSKLTNVMIEKKLGTRGTGRNWNTVLKLAALAEAL
jgi:uncharacterized protein (DUF1697 family)